MQADKPAANQLVCFAYFKVVNLSPFLRAFVLDDTGGFGLKIVRVAVSGIFCHFN